MESQEVINLTFHLDKRTFLILWRKWKCVLISNKPLKAIPQTSGTFLVWKPLHFPPWVLESQSRELAPMLQLIFHKVPQMLNRFPTLSVTRISSLAQILLYFLMPGMCMAPQPSSAGATSKHSRLFHPVEQKAWSPPLIWSCFSRKGPWLAHEPRQGLFPCLLAMEDFREPERRKSGLLPLAVVPFSHLLSQKAISLGWTWLFPPRQAQQGSICIPTLHSSRVP